MMFEILQLFFDKNLIVAGYIYFCKSSIIRLDIASKLIIIFAYLVISLPLFYVLRHRSNIPFQKIFGLFFALIMVCGATPLLELFALCYPNYGLSTWFKAIAAGVTLYIAGELAYLIAKVLVPPNRIELEKANEFALAERERYLDALVKVQRRLLAFEKDCQQGFIRQKPYQEILKILGEVSGATLVYVVENHRDNRDRLLMSQKAEWCAPGISSKIKPPTVQNLPYEDFFPRWAKLLFKNEIIAGVVTEFPESERVVLELQGIRSILVLPLTVNGMFFGFIGFYNCTESRPWQATEVDLLSSAAAAVSLWNESILAQRALCQSEAANRALLEAIPDALLRIRRDGTNLDFIPAKNSQTPIAVRKFLGKKIAEVLPPELALKVSADVEAAFSTGKVQVSQVPIHIKDDLHHYEIRTVFYSEDEVLMMGRDVTEQKQAEAALRQSEERFRSLVAHIPGVVYRCACDANRTVEFISDVIEEISGYPAADFLHNQVRTFASVMAPEERARVERIVSKHVAQRKPYVLEYRIVRADGSVRWVYEKGQGVFAADGTLVCLDGVLFDITEYKQTQEELRLREEQFRQLTEYINEVFFLTAPDVSKILYISPAYEDVWGRSIETLYAQPESWLDSIHLDDRDRIVAALTQHIQDVQDFMEEYRVVRPDGSVRWVWVRAFHILNQAGSSERIAGIAEDVTERKLAEVEILNALAKEKELGDLKSRFISITSHEFRTPLATIMSTAELLEYYEWAKQEEVEQLHLIQDAVKHMLELLNDLLFIGTAEAGQVRFNPEPLVLNEFCQELVAEIERGISVNLTDSGLGHTVTFASQGESFLACMDKKLLRQLLGNLLSNAIKYSPEGGDVLFKLTCQDDKAIFEIQDRGIGIPREDQARLFEFFYRAKNVGAIAGTGLGLAIVRTCVDLHRGEIAINSEVGVGTRFTVSLPLKNYFSGCMLKSLPPHTKKQTPIEDASQVS
jgi:PAS domain S-box-containing protein